MTQMVWAEVEVAVCVSGLPVYTEVKAAILPPLYAGVQEWEGTILLLLNGELDGGLNTVEGQMEGVVILPGYQDAWVMDGYNH